MPSDADHNIMSTMMVLLLLLCCCAASVHALFIPLFHGIPACQVTFSPDGRWVLSASFDKSIKLWDGGKGTFIATFRGHVGAVFQVAWSSDSRLFASGSKDSTLKVRTGRRVGM